jgi:Ca-activated chloride channel family protein
MNVTLLAPIALAGLAVPLLIYLIHWLYGSRRRLRVPAIFLWADLPYSSAGRSRRRWPPITALLLLQLLAAVLATLALARPAMPTDPPRHVALILDASASMQATDVAPTRFDAARARALDRLQGVRPADLVTVIRAGREASAPSSGTPDSARSAINSMQPGLTPSAIREALALASTRVAQTPERRGEIVLITDGAFSPPQTPGLLAAPVEVVGVGGGSDNAAVTALNVSLDPNGRGQTAFVEITNEADHPARAATRLLGDGTLLDERQVDIGPRGRARLSIPLPMDVRRVSVRLQGKDALGLDDTMDTFAPGGPPRDVQLIGRISDGVRRAVEAVPSLRVRPDSQTPDARPPDLTVLQANLPTQLPAGPLLLINPPSNSGRLSGLGLGSGARVLPSHPLLQSLDLTALQEESPSVSTVPGWARVVFGTLQGPLVMEGRLEGHPTVALTFDPTISGLEKSLAFPLLISNASAFLVNQADTPPSATTETFDRQESDIAPRPLPTFSSVAPTAKVDGGPRFDLADEWPWVLGATLVVLGFEWLVFARRG